MLHPVSFTGYMDFETAAYQSVAPGEGPRGRSSKAA